MSVRSPGTDEVIRVAAFRVALRRFFRATELAARERGLTPRQYLLLLLVSGAPDGSQRATIGELAERLHLAQSTVTELVTRTAAAGLVTSSTSPSDGRVSEVRLTSAGERVFAECFRTLESERKALREAFAALDIKVHV